MTEKFPSHQFFDKSEPEENRPIVRPGEKAPENNERRFHVGEGVKIAGSEGKIVEGWKIGEINEEGGYATLMPAGVDDILEAPMTQRVPLEKLAEINPEKPNFEGAKNFEELYAEIDKIGGLQGSTKFYDAEELRKRIEQARKIPPAVESVTNTDGLRDRVIALIQEELAEKLKEPTKTMNPESGE